MLKLEKTNWFITLFLLSATVSYKCREPTVNELNTLPIITITLDSPWNPEHHGESIGDQSSIHPTIGNTTAQKILFGRLQSQHDDISSIDYLQSISCLQSNVNKVSAQN